MFGREGAFPAARPAGRVARRVQSVSVALGQTVGPGVPSEERFGDVCLVSFPPSLPVKWRQLRYSCSSGGWGKVLLGFIRDELSFVCERDTYGAFFSRCA